MGISPTYGTSLDEWFKSFAIGLNGNFCMLGTTNSYGNGLNDVFVVRVDTIFANQPTILITFNDSIPLTIKDTENNSTISIYPNPTQQFLMISISEIKGNTPYFFELYDLQGKSILKKEITNTSTTLNLSQLSKQFYVFKLFKEDEIVSIGKLIVN